MISRNLQPAIDLIKAFRMQGINRVEAQAKRRGSIMGEKTMMHEIKIDTTKCKGPISCQACESIHRGLYAHCSEHGYGRLLVSLPNTESRHQEIETLIKTCPVGAININPVKPNV